MAENKGFFTKAFEAVNVTLDNYIEKAQTNVSGTNAPEWERKGFIEVDYATEQQAGWKERRGLLGPNVMKNMARKDSVIIAIIQTRLSQVSMFAKPQRDKYSPGFVVRRKKPLDIPREEKIKLLDPALTEEERQKQKYKAQQSILKDQEQEEEDCRNITEFLMHCGQPNDEVDTTRSRWSFSKFVNMIIKDRLTYNYAAVERIFTKDGSKLHHFYPVSSGTIRFASERSKELLKERLKQEARGSDNPQASEAMYEKIDEYKYLQIIRGRVVAAWTEKEFIFEPGTPTVDPEDMGYAVGELEMLIQLITSHLYGEAHNRNYFSQGIGSKGILHIKGDNIARSQLEAFKRQWFNQIQNTRNAFRPPIIGMADEVRWVQLAQSNKDMEFENWMQYLIKLICAVYQIDPAEINFDISKVQTSTLNETSNEHRIKSSRDKGLRPLLDYVEYIINTEILPFWDQDLAAQYEFAFVGLDAETRTQEAERLTKEVQTYKTFNEARMEVGKEPIEGGDIIGNAQYAQALMVQMQQNQAAPNEEEMKEQEKKAKEEEKRNKKLFDEIGKDMEEATSSRPAGLKGNEGDETEVQTGKKRPPKDIKQQKDDPDETGGVGVGPKGGEYITKPDGTKEYRRVSKKDDDKEDTKKSQVKIEYYSIKGLEDED